MSNDVTENDLDLPPKKRSRLSSKYRKFTKIPVFIVEAHNDVLDFIYKCFSSRHLPFEGNILIHFDSHPDMVIDRQLKSTTAYDKNELLSELSIENWIMPACYAGHFKDLIWIKNSWCNQLPVGRHSFVIGDRDDQLHVSWPVDYYISEGNYCDEALLQNKRTINIQVIDSDAKVSAAVDYTALDKDNPNLILDIDLDFFSTKNPFLEIYKNCDCYDRMTEIFSYEDAAAGDNHEEVSKVRQQQLDSLNAIFSHLDEHRTLTEFPKDLVPEKMFDKILDLVQCLTADYEDSEIDWKMIMDAGSTSDHDGLPHHISTDEELSSYLADFKMFLESLPRPPVIVTIARSSLDGYCPADKVDSIQEQVLNTLCDVFGDAITTCPILDYADDDWDVMKL